LRDPGRIAAAIEILDAYAERPLPISVLIQDWGRRARYAGSKDRAFVRGLCLDVLRRWRSTGASEDRRRGVAVLLREVWRWPEDRIGEAFAGEHGPGPLSEEEQTATLTPALDLPPVLSEREDGERISKALAERAPVDLRVNLLKGDRAKALKATGSLGAAETPLSPIGLRIAPAQAAEKGPGVTVIPAYGKGLVEVQDEGSQLTVLACGDLRGKQVMDYCAGGGGKTLALAAQMANTGQIFAYDSDPQRLAPIHERLRRAGARNVQVLPPQEPERLGALRGSMDLVFIDAPCSGSGTWRRHPDAKWRLSEEHLGQRQEEQDQVLREASAYVRPGGVIVFVTCSFLESENEERVQAFTGEWPEFKITEPLAGDDEELGARLLPYVQGNALRLAPWSSGTDGFTLMRLVRQ
jgi:16S rRNA (cytosine967-C5)-methyltransferase